LSNLTPIQLLVDFTSLVSTYTTLLYPPAQICQCGLPMVLVNYQLDRKEDDVVVGDAAASVIENCWLTYLLSREEFPADAANNPGHCHLPI